MVQLPLSPCLSKAVLASLQFGCDELMLPIAAMLSVENVFAQPGSCTQLSKASKCWSKLGSLAGGDNDFLMLLYIFQECFKRYVTL